MPRGRKPVGDRAMTAAERQQRARDKINARTPKRGTAERLRLDLFKWVRLQAMLHPKLDVAHLEMLLKDLAQVIRMDAYCYSVGHGHHADYQRCYLNPRESTEDWYSRYTPEPKKPAGYGLEVLEAIDNLTPADLEDARKRYEAEREAERAEYANITPEERGRAVMELQAALSAVLGRPSPPVDTPSNEASSALRSILDYLPLLTADERAVVRQQLEIMPP